MRHPPNVFNKQCCWQPKLTIYITSGPITRSKEKRRIHRVSSVAELVISGDSVLTDNRKEVAKDRKMDLARFFLGGTAWSFDSELFEAVVLQADFDLDCGATEPAGVRGSADSGRFCDTKVFLNLSLM